jgi:TonB family protein
VVETQAVGECSLLTAEARPCFPHWRLILSPLPRSTEFGYAVLEGLSVITEIIRAGIITVALAAQEDKKPPEQVYRVGGDVTAPKLLTRVEPSYPQAARDERIEGVVILEALITKSGNVVDIKVLKTVHPLVDAAAARAVGQWVYRPSTLNGEPVAVYLTVTSTFNLGVRPPEPRPPDSLVGTWQVPGQRAWVQIDKRNRAYGCRISYTDVVSKASGIVEQTPEGKVIRWESAWSPHAVTRDGDDLLLVGGEGRLRFRPLDGKMAKSCAK